MHSIWLSPNLILLSVIGNSRAPHITVVRAAYSWDREGWSAVDLPRVLRWNASQQDQEKKEIFERSWTGRICADACL